METKIEEIWKDVPGYAGQYQASTLGRVKSLERKAKTWFGERTVSARILKLFLNKTGYLTFYLGSYNSQLIHRVIAQTHIPNPENKPCVNHKDGDKANNHVDNLEWVTYGENETHSFRVLGKTNHLFKYSNAKKAAIKALFAEGKSVREVMKKHKLSEGYLYELKRGHR